MDKIDDVRTKQIETNLEQFKTNPNRLSDVGEFSPQEVRSIHYRPADLRRIRDYLELLIYMLLDSFNRKYPIPKKIILVITLTFLYLINPIDISPDIIPLVGFVDDVAVLAFAFSLLKDDLEKYRYWKMNINNNFVYP